MSCLSSILLIILAGYLGVNNMKLKPRSSKSARIKLGLSKTEQVKVLNEYFNPPKQAEPGLCNLLLKPFRKGR